MSVRVSVAVFALVLSAVLSVRGADAAPATPVQDRYAAPGPAEVVHVALTDSFGDVPYELYRPADLGPPGTRHPLVTWGNGSFAHPVDYDPFLRHLASWGFVVVASTNDQVGTGNEMLGGVKRIGRMAEDPDDPLFGHVDLDHVAASGHSQGAGGSVRAATAPDSPITTVLVFDLPNDLFAFPPDTKGFDASALQVPVLFLSGSEDELISGSATNRDFFASVPGPAGVALLVGADHNGIQHGARPFPGYATAWLRYQLAADPVAATAFTGHRPELLTAPGWRDQALKGLVPPPAAVAAEPQVPASTTVAPTTPTAAGRGLPATGGTQAAVPLALAAALVSFALRRATQRGGGGVPGSRRPPRSSPPG